jgi:ABC-type branched-subunit amino acid transport system permease subunit/ABC-type branched-subunit amino acid transport system ATPase component
VRVAARAAIVGLIAVAITNVLSPYERYIVARISVLIIVTASLNLLMGNAGLLSLASAAFMGIGAYTLVILMLHTTLPFPLLAVAAVALAWTLGWLMGLISLRLSGFYLALVTFGSLIAFQTLLIQGSDQLTGAGYGLVTPIPTLFGHVLNSDAWVAAAVFSAAGVVVLVKSLSDTQVGRAWKAMRANEISAEQNGMDITRLKTSAFALTAAMAAFAGVLYAFLQGAVSPEQFDLAATIQQLTYVVVGGVGSVAGSVIGPIVIELIPEVMRPVGQQRELVFGVVLLVMLVVAPRGLAGVVRAATGRVAPYLPRLPAPNFPIPRLARSAKSKRRAAAGNSHLASPGARPLARDLSDRPAVVFKGVSVRYGGLAALSGLDLEVERGTLHGLIGPNGAGKTTVINAIVGLAPISTGEIYLNDQLLRHPSGGVKRSEMARNGVARTFQTSAVVPTLSAVENVMLGLHSTLHAGIVAGALRPRSVRSAEELARDRSVEALQLVGFDKDIAATAATWSAGDLRRIELARALVQRPRLLLLDEPAAGLEVGAALALVQLLRRLTADKAAALTITPGDW